MFCKRHLKRLQHFCDYLVKMKHVIIKFHTHEPEYSNLLTRKYKWFLIHGEVTGLLPQDAPKPFVNSVMLTHYVNANLFHYALIGRLVTGDLHIINAAHIDWYSKEQYTVEEAAYGSEYAATCICIKQVNDLCNML